jgi:hypothetical protein
MHRLITTALATIGWAKTFDTPYMAGELSAPRSVDPGLGLMRNRRLTFNTVVRISLLGLLCTSADSSAQHQDKPRPESWEHLAFGGRFMDRILPAPVHEGLETDTWGTEKVGKDLVVTFDAADHGLADDNFAAKLIGRTARRGLLFGYSRLPGVDYSPHVVGQ